MFSLHVHSYILISCKQGQIQTFVQEVTMKLRFLSAAAVCKAHSEM